MEKGIYLVVDEAIVEPLGVAESAFVGEAEAHRDGSAAVVAGGAEDGDAVES